MTAAEGAKGRLVRLGAGLAAAVLLAACDGGEAGRPPEPTPGSATEGEDVVTPAVYISRLTFVGFGADGGLVHLRFRNRTTPSALLRRYRGWRSRDGAWRPVLSLRDSLPVPRAAWRTLPAVGLRIRVGETGEIDGLVIGRASGRLRLDAGETLAEWTGMSGLRETLRRASLRDGNGEEQGLLLFQQSARPERIRSEPPAFETLLVADTLGNGLLMMRSRAVPESPARAWTWMGGEVREWLDAVLRPLKPREGAPGRWALELPGAGITGELDGVAVAFDERPEADTADGRETSEGARAFRLTGTLVVGGTVRPVVGVGLDGRGI
ncbi:MAG: hypothetical protein ACE5HF_08055 [Gemmatimonadota bacterium]